MEGDGWRMGCDDGMDCGGWMVDRMDGWMEGG